MIRAALAEAVEQLRAAGLEEPTADAERLLAAILGTDRVRLRLGDDRPLASEVVARYVEQVKRRAEREPVQHLVGECEFHGLAFSVTRDVLIPRPETEGIVDVLVADAGWRDPGGSDAAAGGTDADFGPASGHDPSGGASGASSGTRAGFAATVSPEATIRRPFERVADVGTGSGCLAVTIAVRFPGAQVIATDVSAAALAVARRNAERHGVAARIEFRQGDGLDPLAGERLDALVSNPPYVTDAEFADLSREVREYEPALALRGGPDGLGLICVLATGAGRVLRPGGRLLLEIGWRQAAAVRALFERGVWQHVRFHRDLQGIERVVEAVRTTDRG